MVRSEQPQLVMEEVTDPQELEEARRRKERFDRNWTWFESHAAEIYKTYRGKCLCISGEEVFAGDTPAEALALAKSAHPEDDGRFTRIIPEQRLERIYVN